MKNSDWISKREFSRYPVVIFGKRLKCVEIHLLVLLLDEKFTFFFEIKGDIILKNLKEEERKITRRVFERSAADLPCTPQVLFFFLFLVSRLSIIPHFLFSFRKKPRNSFSFSRMKKNYRIFVCYCSTTFLRRESGKFN